MDFSRPKRWRGVALAAVILAVTGILLAMWGGEDADAKEDESLDPQQRLLARVVFAEGTYEPMPAKIAIARTVLNRVGDKAFPDDLETVVHQKDAFTAVTTRSRLWRLSDTPGKMNGLQKRRWRESLQAAGSALDGRGNPQIIAYRVVGIRGGEAYFRQLEPVMTLGNHRFYKHRK